jgi:hypothetical protein
LKKIGSFVFSLFWLIGAGAQGISVDLTTDRTVGSEQEPFQFQITVSGTRNAGTPVIENAADFDMQSGGTSTQIQIINGVTSSSGVTTFLLYPKKEGTFTVGPAKVEVDGQTYSSRTVRLKVVKESAAEIAPKDKPYFVTSTVNNKKPFVNEQIEYVFRFYRRAQLADAKLDLPNFNGFWKEETQKQKDFQQIKNGLQWAVTEVRFALFPEKPGELEIPPAILNARFIVQGKRQSPFDSFFGDSFFSQRQSKSYRLKSKSIKLKIRSLPEKKFSGLVGRFQLESHLSKRELSVGESTTLTLKIKGDGNVRDVLLPEIKWNAIKVYDDQPKLNTSVSAGRLYGEKIFKLALVPLKEGPLEIPEVKIKYFDPGHKDFRLLVSPSQVLDVKPGELTQNIGHFKGANSKKSVEFLGEDIMPIKRSLSALESDKLSRAEVLMWLGAGFFMNLLTLGVTILKRRHDRLSGDTRYLKRSKAFKSFRKGVKAIVDSNAPHEEASHTLRVYLGDKMGMDGKALTSLEASKSLLEKGVSESLAIDVKAFLHSCEMAEYGGGQGAINHSELSKNLVQLGEKLEKEIRS